MDRSNVQNPNRITPERKLNVREPNPLRFWYSTVHSFLISTSTSNSYDEYVFPQTASYDFQLKLGQFLIKIGPFVLKSVHFLLILGHFHFHWSINVNILMKKPVHSNSLSLLESPINKDSN